MNVRKHFENAFKIEIKKKNVQIEEKFHFYLVFLNAYFTLK